jgi:glutamine synthetase
MHACDYLLACDMEMDPVPGYALTSWEAGYGDFNAIADLGTLRRAAWLDRTALVLCDLVGEDGGEPVSVAPRSILRRQVERAATLGWFLNVGSELEFFILADSYESAKAKNFEGLDTFGWYVEDYHALRGSREEPLVGAIRRAMDASGVPVEFSKGEWGPGQHEINLRYTEAMEMADRHVIYKQAAKDIAAGQDHALTFMAKLDETLAGNSFHLHSSLWSVDGDQALFAPEHEGAEMGDLFRWYLGGLLAHARACSLFFAPNANSYKRYRPGTFAPTRLAWAHDNRTAGFRVIGRGNSTRVECRLPGADANPYLAMAATLAAGLDGIEKRIEPSAMFKGDAYLAGDLPSVPATLEEALEEFCASALMRQALGEEVVAHYSRFAEVELEKSRAVVTGWERRRFLERG